MILVWFGSAGTPFFVVSGYMLPTRVWISGDLSLRQGVQFNSLASC